MAKYSPEQTVQAVEMYSELGNDGLGKIAEDQVEDYSNRKGDEKEKTEKWLRPVLNYDTDL